MEVFRDFFEAWLIVNMILQKQDRFFNSLVITVHGLRSPRCLEIIVWLLRGERNPNLAVF